MSTLNPSYAISSYGNSDSELEFYQDAAIDRLKLQTQMMQFTTMTSNTPLNAGDVARWGHVPEWPTISSAITEMSTSGNLLNVAGAAGHTVVSATLVREGGHISLSEFGLRTLPVEILEEHAERAGDSAQRRLDTLAIIQGEASSNYWVPDGLDDDGTAVANSGTITKGNAVLGTGVVTSGAFAKAEDFSYLQGELHNLGNLGFDHINGDYGAVVHSRVSAHLGAQRAGTDFAPTFATINNSTAVGQDLIRKGFLKSMYGVSIFKSPLIRTVTTTGATDAPYYKNLVMGRYCIGRSSLEGPGDANFRIVIREPGSQTTSDPYGSFRTIAWVWDGVFKLTSADRAIVYRTAIATNKA